MTTRQRLYPVIWPGERHPVLAVEPASLSEAVTAHHGRSYVDPADDAPGAWLRGRQPGIDFHDSRPGRFDSRAVE